MSIALIVRVSECASVCGLPAGMSFWSFGRECRAVSRALYLSEDDNEPGTGIECMKPFVNYEAPQAPLPIFPMFPPSPSSLTIFRFFFLRNRYRGFASLVSATDWRVKGAGQGSIPKGKK